MSVFVVDSNFFIQAHRERYPMDVAPSFWNKVKQLAEEGVIISIDKVKNEIYKIDDELKTWCIANLPESFFKDTSAITDQYSLIVLWASSKSNHYLPKALAEFLDADEADAWLVAYALEEKNTRTVVTYEVSDPRRRNKVKIPEACMAHDIRFINPIEMFRLIGQSF